MIELTSSSVVVQIRGLEDVQAKFRVLGTRVATNVIRRGLLAGGGVIRKEARLRAPVRKRKDGTPAKGSGTLRKSIVAQTRGVFRDASGQPIEHRAVVLIAKRKSGPKPRRYAHLVEFGTKPHFVGKGARAQRTRGNRVQLAQAGGPGRWHPGAKAQPFMEPAFQAKRLEALRVVVTTIRREVDVEVAKLSRFSLAGVRARAI